MTIDREIARAKVNLALHVVGRRADGYHLLDSLVAFPPTGDILTAQAADRLSLVVEGPGAAALGDTPAETNLVFKAATGLAALASRPVGAAIRLEKHLPVAAGLGGGSADAGAAIRLLCRLWDIDTGKPEVTALAVRLGADVPMCVASSALRAQGIGDEITALSPLPPLGIVIANPRRPVATPAIFKALASRDNPPIEALPPTSAEGFIAALEGLRNDLEPPAIGLEPAIREVKTALGRLPGCRLERMSGSGASCFALFDDPPAAAAAAERLKSEQPGWWVVGAAIA